MIGDRPDRRSSRCAAPRDHCCLEAQRPAVLCPPPMLVARRSGVGWAHLVAVARLERVRPSRSTGLATSLARNRQRHPPARRRVLRGHHGRRRHHRDHRDPFIYETAARAAPATSAPAGALEGCKVQRTTRPSESVSKYRWAGALTPRGRGGGGGGVVREAASARGVVLATPHRVGTPLATPRSSWWRRRARSVGGGK